MKRHLEFGILLIMLLLLPFSVFSMNNDFTNNPHLWFESDCVTVSPPLNIDKLCGVYSYYSDTENNKFYFHISYYEETMTEYGNEVKIRMNVENSVNGYEFFINGNGFINPGSAVKSAFNANVNFQNATEQGQEIFADIEFCNKQDKRLVNYISFTLYVNGNSYALCSNALLDLHKEETTVNKKETTTKKSVTTFKDFEKQTVSDNSKNYADNSVSKAEKSTKFKYIPPEGKSSGVSKNNHYVISNSTDNNSSEDEGEEPLYVDSESAESVSEGSGIAVNNERKTGLTPAAKAMICCSTLLFIAGMAFVICSILIKDKRINKISDREDSPDKD